MEEESVFSLIVTRLSAKSGSPLHSKASLIINLIKDTLEVIPRKFKGGSKHKGCLLKAPEMALFSIFEKERKAYGLTNNNYKNFIQAID